MPSIAKEMREKQAPLAGAVSLAITLGVGAITTAPVMYPKPAMAFDIVYDPWNYAKNLITAIESVAQTLHMIEDAVMQLKHYEDMIKNTLAPVAYVFDKVQEIERTIADIADTVNNFTNLFGDFDAYLQKYQDIDYYRDSPCFKKMGCSKEEWNLVQSVKDTASKAKMTANEAVMKLLRQQQTSITDEAKKLDKLADKVTDSNGRMEAMQHANELAAMENQQLLQIRQLMMTQQASVTTEMQDEANQDAIHVNGDRLYFVGSYEKTVGGSGGW